jgi:hypothetical protein
VPSHAGEIAASRFVRLAAIVVLKHANRRPGPAACPPIGGRGLTGGAPPLSISLPQPPAADPTVSGVEPFLRTS